MKELIQKILNEVKQPSYQKLMLAEFLQHLVLQSIHRNGGFKSLVFTGGTALRLLYHTNRYSEDLDFSLLKTPQFHFETILDKIQRDLKDQQLPFEFRVQDHKVVAKADLKFPNLLQEFSLSALSHQKLTLKIEVDKNPPKGGKKEMNLVTSPIAYTVAAFDLPSMFATKLHALFFRPYLKGRDYYDLAWYLDRRVLPNFKLLNNAISQTQGKGHQVLEGMFKPKLIKHLESVDFKRIRQDVERFLIKPDEAKLLALEPIKSLLRHYD